MCETPRILKAAGSTLQKGSFRFQNWSRSKVGKNFFRQPAPLLTKEMLPLFPRYWTQGRYLTQIFIPLHDTTHRFATDSEKSLPGWVHLHHSPCALWKEATKTVRVRIPGSLRWNGLCINETRTMAYQWACQCGRGKSHRVPPLDKELQATVRVSLSQAWVLYWMSNTKWSSVIPYTHKQQKQTQQPISALLWNTHVTIIIKEEEALNLRVGYMGGVGQGIGGSHYIILFCFKM